MTGRPLEFEARSPSGRFAFRCAAPSEYEREYEREREHEHGHDRRLARAYSSELKTIAKSPNGATQWLYLL